jgi:hypothetical protein
MIGIHDATPDTTPIGHGCIVGWAQLHNIFKLKADLPQPQRRSRPVATAAALV